MNNLGQRAFLTAEAVDFPASGGFAPDAKLRRNLESRALYDI